jgi:hypothetical protein
VLSLLSGSSAVARELSAAPPERLQLLSNSSCPSASDVAQQLAPLLQHTQVSVGAEEGNSAGATQVKLTDSGEELEVRVGPEVRVFRDPGRACTERARSSAVFIGLVLDPPLLPEAPEPKPSAPAKVAATPPPTEPKPRPSAHLVLELGPLLQAAPISDSAQLPLAGGFGGRLAWGKTWGAAFGAAFLLPTRLHLPAADARVVWLPFDLSLRLTQGGPALSWSAELGPELALLFATGEGVDNPRTSTRVELGARGAVSLSWGMGSHVGAFVTLFSELRPKPYDFRVNPDMASGSSPAWWLGSSLGLSLRSD